MRVVTLANRRFEVAEDRRHFMKTDNEPFHLPFDENNVQALYECYAEPSTTKQYVWYDWCKWARENGASLWITSYNCMRFSISGRILVDGKWWNLHITALHNRATPVHGV